MNEQKSNQPIDVSDANKHSEYLEQEAKKETNQELTYEQQAENEIAHEQNITAHVPGGSTIADIDR